MHDCVTKACCFALQVLYDLLSAAPGSVGSLQIVEEGGATVVKGLTQIQVTSEEEALALLFEGIELVNLARLCFFPEHKSAIFFNQDNLSTETNKSCTGMQAHGCTYVGTRLKLCACVKHTHC